MMQYMRSGLNSIVGPLNGPHPGPNLSSKPKLKPSFSIHVPECRLTRSKDPLFGFHVSKSLNGSFPHSPTFIYSAKKPGRCLHSLSLSLSKADRYAWHKTLFSLPLWNPLGKDMTAASVASGHWKKAMKMGLSLFRSGFNSSKWFSPSLSFLCWFHGKP